MLRASHSLLLVLALGLVATAAAGQGGSWPTVHQQALWVTTTLEHRVSPKTSLWFDGNWRRMGFGGEPQQVLLRPGILHTIAPGVRIGAGYTYVGTAPYGEVPAPTPLREHRTWQQLTVTHAAGPAAITHRYRWEQRWIATVTTGYGYQQRARYMVRAQLPLGGLTYRSRAVIGYLQEELLLPVGHGGSAGRFTQNRFAVGAGLPLTARQRLDVGYMNLWNAIASRPANEVNHTVTINWVVTSGR
ncbi:MAG: DUF2490 domain-containing protein [Gemmatimonadetes bacterium]|nr:DUF2490 domain-containing protein [Gemmatimonadota bacterium]